MYAVCIMMLQRNTGGLELNLKARVNEVMAIILILGINVHVDFFCENIYVL